MLIVYVLTILVFFRLYETGTLRTAADFLLIIDDAQQLNSKNLTTCKSDSVFYLRPGNQIENVFIKFTSMLFGDYICARTPFRGAASTM
jgi:hypothetical protein